MRVWVKIIVVCAVVLLVAGGAYFIRQPRPGSQPAVEFSIEKIIAQRLAIAVINISDAAIGNQLTDVLLKIEGQTLKLIVSDGRRILAVDARLDSSNTEDFAVTLPSDGVREIANMRQDSGSDEGRFSVKGLTMTARFGRTRFVLPCREADALPPYEDFMPAPSADKLTVNRQEFLDALDAFSQAGKAGQDKDKISITAEYNRLKVALLQNFDSQPEVKTLVVQYRGPYVTESFNLLFLRDFLRKTAVGDEAVSLEFHDLPSVDGKTLVSRGENYTYVLLPLKK